MGCAAGQTQGGQSVVMGMGIAVGTLLSIGDMFTDRNKNIPRLSLEDMKKQAPEAACILGAAAGGVLHLGANFYSAGTFQAVLSGIGSGLAAVVSFSIAATFGTGLMFLMWFTGIIPAGRMLSWRRVPALLEIIPGINFFPAWTGVTWLAIMECEAEQLGGTLGNITRLGAMAISGNIAGAAKEIGGAAKASYHGAVGRAESVVARRVPADAVEGVMEPQARTRGRVPLATRTWSVAPDNEPASKTPNTKERNIASKQLMSKPA